MNKNYIYIDGMVEVTNELGNFRKVEYCDNIEEILIKENLIEQMELEHKKLKKEKKHNKNISFKLLTKSLFTLLMIPIFLIILPLILGIIELTSLPILGSILVIGIPGYLSFFLMYEYIKTNKINKGLDNQTIFLENEINCERVNLEKLNKNKVKQNEQTLVHVSKRVDDIKELKNMRNKLLLYYQCGYNQEKYQKYFKQGKLKKELLKYYTEEQSCCIEEYLQAKVCTLNKIN